MLLECYLDATWKLTGVLLSVSSSLPPPPLLHLCLPAALPQLIGSEVRLLFAHLLAEWRRLARITSTLLLFINAYNKGDRWVKGQLQE